MVTREVLVSPGYGAGWASWACADAQHFMLFYQPFIDALKEETDRALVDYVGAFYTSKIPAALLPVMAEFEEDWETVFGNKDFPYYGGLKDIEVQVVNGPFRLEEYDGWETVVTSDADAWF